MLSMQYVYVNEYATYIIHKICITHSLVQYLNIDRKLERFLHCVREAAKKVLFLVVRPLRKKELKKKMCSYILAQKLWRIFFCQNPFPAILRRKKKQNKKKFL